MSLHSWSGVGLPMPNAHPLQKSFRSRTVIHGPGLTEDTIAQREEIAVAASNVGGSRYGGWEWNEQMHGPKPV